MAVSLPHYPPPEDLSNELPLQQHYVRRASSSLPPNAYEDASLKYPTLENVEHDYDKKKNQEQQQSVNESDFPDVSKVSQFNNRGEEDEGRRNSGASGASSNKKFVVEPEPLIEL